MTDILGFQDYELGSNKTTATSFGIATSIVLLSIFLFSLIPPVPKETEEPTIEVKFVESLPPPAPKIKFHIPATTKPTLAIRRIKVIKSVIPTKIIKTILPEAIPTQTTIQESSPDAQISSQEQPKQVIEAQPLPEFAEPPKPSQTNMMPEFPLAAKEQGLSGLVILKIIISEDGSVLDVKVLKGTEPFITAAITAVKTWHYSPATLDGKPLKISRIIKIPFELKT